MNGLSALTIWIENIDTGGIIDVVRFKISKEFETAKSLEAKSQPFLYDLFIKNISQVIESNGVLKTTPNYVVGI